jgi:hypothetical protein
LKQRRARGVARPPRRREDRFLQHVSLASLHKRFLYSISLPDTWRKHLFDPLQAPLATAILRLVAAQCDGASIDQALFVSLGLDVDLNKECLGVYKE